VENDPEREKEFELQKLLQITQEMTDDEVQRIISYAETLQILRTHELS
jgi:hypothetical protein